jgi:DNA-binding transcriptional LysR family regulator
LFNEDGHEKEIYLAGNYTCSEDVLGGVTLAKAGAGLFQTYKFIVEKELADGTLVEVLQPFAGRSRPYSLLYPHGRLLPSRVRVFVDFMMEQTGLAEAAKVPGKKRSR